MALTDSHNTWITAWHVVGHNSGQRSKFVFLHSIFTCNDHSSSAIRDALETKNQGLYLLERYHKCRKKKHTPQSYPFQDNDWEK